MTTQQGPITINNLINKLKLLPGDWKIQIDNSNGSFHIEGLDISTQECLVTLLLKKIP